MATKMQFGLSTMLLVPVVASVGLMLMLNQRTLSQLADETRRNGKLMLTDHCTVIDSWSSRLWQLSRRVDATEQSQGALIQQLQIIVLEQEQRIKRLEAQLAGPAAAELPASCQ